MDAKETFYDRPYMDWIRNRHRTAKAHDQFQETVRNARAQGHEGPVSGKVRSVDFTHLLNELVGHLQSHGNLPALFFVLSRKGCEEYARRVSHDLLTSSETSAVANIIGFHLSRYKSLETMPQFHIISDLLKRGIAFHHSGLLPLLKEIVEILFSKGLVRLLFATETFAVGLNMPTKTVVFTGLKKYDDHSERMRILRTDEYTQMAGRAGRRGKDTEGLVIYLPDREPVSVEELRQIMKGNRQPVESRMDFHYDFLLKTLQSKSLQWLGLMERSYWFRQRARQLDETHRNIHETEEKIATLVASLPTGALEEVERRKAIETRLKQSVNQAKRNAQRELGQWDNTHMGPVWINATKLYPQVTELRKSLVNLHEDITNLQSHRDHVLPALEFLKIAGFMSDDTLTLRGVLASEINEGHPIMMSEFFLRGSASTLSGEELVGVLASFLEGEEKADEARRQASIESLLHVSPGVQSALYALNDIALEYMRIEDSISTNLSSTDYWKLSLFWIDPILRWVRGEHIAILCQEYGIFEGNFTRAILKINNILDEWLSLATFCNRPEQIEGIIEVKGRLVRDIVLPDSLYLRI
jgi:superfamily II RNA helicase